MDLDRTLRANLTSVRDRISRACDRVGRDPSGVRLMGVTKRKPVEVVMAACRAGLVDLGENYAQELQEKSEIIAEAGLSPRWHFIGALQTNKVRTIAGLITSVHSVDRPSLVKELGKRVTDGRSIEVFVEVSVAGEAQKSGVAPKEAEVLCRQVLEAPGLELAGLMCVPPWSRDPEASRSWFRSLRELRDDLVESFGAAPGVLSGLSMGMTHDVEVAVEEGATIVRVGTALFGPRD